MPLPQLVHMGQPRRGRRRWVAKTKMVLFVHAMTVHCLLMHSLEQPCLMVASLRPILLHETNWVRNDIVFVFGWNFLLTCYRQNHLRNSSQQYFRGSRMSRRPWTCVFAKSADVQLIMHCATSSIFCCGFDECFCRMPPSSITHTPAAISLAFHHSILLHSNSFPRLLRPPSLMPSKQRVLHSRICLNTWFGLFEVSLPMSIWLSASRTRRCRSSRAQSQVR